MPHRLSAEEAVRPVLYVECAPRTEILNTDIHLRHLLKPRAAGLGTINRIL